MAEQGGAWMGDPAGSNDDDLQKKMLAMQQQMSGNSPESQKLLDASRVKQENLLDEQANLQRSQIEQLKQSLSDYRATPQEVDLSPLASYVDYLNEGKTNMAGAYAKSGMPESEEDRKKTIFQMQRAITDAEGKLTAQQLDALSKVTNASKATMNPYALTRIMQTEETNRRHKVNLERGLEKDLRNDIDKKVLDPSAKEKKMFNKIETAFQEGDIIEVQSLLSSFTRNVGEDKGALSEGDVRRSFYEDLETRLNKGIALFGGKGQISENNKRALMNTIGHAKDAARSFYTERLNQVRDSYDVGGTYDEYLREGGFAHNMFSKAGTSLHDRIFPAPKFNKDINKGVKGADNSAAKRKKRMEELRAKAKGG